MFHILVDLKNYTPHRNLIDLGTPEGMQLHWVDLGTPEIDPLLPQTDAILGLANLSDAQYRQADRLRHIQTISAGVNEIDLNRAREFGVTVANNCGANAISVSEHVLMMMLAVYRQLLFHHHSVVHGPWEARKKQNREIFGKSLGIVGLGQIGQALAVRAQALGMQVRYFDVVERPELGYEYRMLPELIAESDFVSYHVPLTRYTAHLINAQTLSWMKPDAVLINASRGGVQDERALHEVLAAGKIAGAGLDVFEQEPIPEDSPIKLLTNVVLTPHSCPTREYYMRAVEFAFNNLRSVQQTGQPSLQVQNYEADTEAFLQAHPEVDWMPGV
jgi:D-3-phosphoglycerate dehydrogenase